MGKQSGLGMRFYVGGYALHGDIGSFDSIHGGPAALEVTGVDKSAYERIGGKRDGGMSLSSWFNDATGQSHPRFSLLPTSDQVMTLCVRAAIGSSAASLNAKQVNYDPTRGEDGALSSKVDGQANGYGLEWGTLVTAASRTDTGATNGAAVDFGGSTAFGLQAYLQVVAFTGTDATVKLQMDDNSGFSSPTDVTGGAFTTITTAPQAQRIETARGLTIEQYLRVSTTTSGGFSLLEFIVMVAKNPVSVVF